VHHREGPERPSSRALLFGLAEPIVINRGDTIIGGHARVKGLKRSRGKNAKVDVYLPDRLLDDKEVQGLRILLNKNVADNSTSTCSRISSTRTTAWRGVQWGRAWARCFASPPIPNLDN
jgi:hypothetical protein